MVEAEIAKLDEHLAQTGVTDDGRKFLIHALDPFHDIQGDLRGYPGGAIGNSIVIKQKETLTLTKPGAGAWDCHVTVLNEDVVTSYGYIQDVTAQHAYAAPANAEIMAIGPILIGRVDNGVITWPTEGTGNAAANIAAMNGGNYQPNTIPNTNNDFQDRPHRLIGLGFEVHNVSPELYKSGTVCCYRQNSSAVKEYNLVSNIDINAGATYDSVGNTSPAPPPNMDEARMIPNSTVYEAARGAYVVATLNDDSIPVATREMVHHHWVYDPVLDPAHTTVCMGTANRSVPGGSYHIPPTHPNRFSNSGAYFSGLHEDSVLEVTGVLYWEVFPTTRAAGLIRLATPGAEEDPIALRYYHAIVRHLPPGVPVDMNAKGDYWRTVFAIADAVSSVLSIIPSPIAKIPAKLYQASRPALVQLSRSRRNAKKKLRKAKKKSKTNTR